MSAHSGIIKIISAAALLVTLMACTSTVQPHHQRPTSADPVPASSSVSTPPSPAVNVAVTGLAFDAHQVISGQRVTITGPMAARQTSAHSGRQFVRL